MGVDGVSEVEEESLVGGEVSTSRQDTEGDFICCNENNRSDNDDDDSQGGDFPPVWKCENTKIMRKSPAQHVI